MVYTPKIPQASDRFKDSQPLIKGNFIDIDSGFNLNHVNFNNGTDTGKHKFLQMPEQGAAPTTAPGPEMGLYVKNSTLTSNPEMFIRRNNDGIEIGMTEYLGAGTGWSRLPSGLLLKWGFVAPSLPNPATITFPVGATIPIFNNLYSVQVSPANNAVSDLNWSASIVNTSLTAASFQVWMTQRTSTTSTAIQLYYLAIGD